MNFLSKNRYKKRLKRTIIGYHYIISTHEYLRKNKRLHKFVKLTLRQLLYMIVLFLVVAFSVMTCSKQLLLPVINRDIISQEDIVVQRAQEDSIKANIDELLCKLVGKSTFFVSVMVSLRDESTREVAIERDPKRVSENVITKRTQAFEDLKRLALKRRPSVKNIRTALALQDDMLPGLVMPEVSINDLESLPGFPLLPKKTLQNNVEEEAKGQIIEEENFSSDDMEPYLKRVEEDAYEYNKEHVFYNETERTTTKPSTLVDKIFVSVVIDEQHFSMLDIKKDTLEDLVRSVSGVDLDRGDQLTLSYTPFVVKSFDLQRFYVKNKKMFQKIGSFFDKIKWVFLGLLGACILGGLGWMGYLSVRKKMDIRAKRLEEERQARLKDLSNQEQEKVDEFEEKRKSVISLAKSKPQEFAQLIMNWVEIEEE